ncbi:MAG TPA: TIGR01777 family oxidoreductase [Acidimicrobiales bacterium]|nr:TIGR01777 family oxidoreductase [Acidimicrobiales bacterium]
MNVLVTGSHGLIGSALVQALQLGGHKVRRAIRGAANPPDVTWDIPSMYIDAKALEGVEAVVHLAGEGVAARRWNAAQKERIRGSRVDGTRLLSEALADLDRPPAVLVSGSAVGWYGDRGNEVLTEDSPPGDDFLSRVCQEWEAATAPAADAGVRVVHLRTGIVQTARGGALRKQLPLFRAGLGGRLGNGLQWVSWISLADEIGAVLHVLRRDSLHGPVNATAPNPVTNAELTKALGRALHRPAVLPVPRLALSVALGAEMAASLLGSQRALPTRLEADGFTFRHPTVDDGLAAALRDV